MFKRQKTALFLGLWLGGVFAAGLRADPSGHGHVHSTSLGDGSGFASSGSGFPGSGSTPGVQPGAGFAVPQPPPPPPERPVKRSTAATVKGTGAGVRSRVQDLGVPGEDLGAGRHRSISSLDESGQPTAGDVVRIGRRGEASPLEN